MQAVYPDIAQVNLSRALRWHPTGLGSWSMSDWNSALVGEIGEVCEVADNIEQPFTMRVHAMAGEVGDVYAYGDLFAQACGLVFVDCIRSVPSYPRTGTMETAALSMAVAGGKLSDVVKKLNRVRDNLGGNKKTPDQLRDDLGYYLGRVGRACDHMADRIGLNLYACVYDKFNTVSERMGFPERLSRFSI